MEKYKKLCYNEFKSLKLRGIKMFRIIVFSDTHGEINSCIKIIENIKDVDMIIHAGDFGKDALKIKSAYPDIPLEYVNGNCDGVSLLTKKEINVLNKKIFLTHGHLYNVKNEDPDYDTLTINAIEKECDIAIFGHTHIPFCAKFNEISIINPGSVKYSRTFGVIEIENDKIGTAILSCSHIM